MFNHSATSCQVTGNTCTGCSNFRPSGRGCTLAHSLRISCPVCRAEGERRGWCSRKTSQTIKLNHEPLMDSPKAIGVPRVETWVLRPLKTVLKLILIRE